MAHVVMGFTPSAGNKAILVSVFFQNFLSILFIHFHVKFVNTVFRNAYRPPQRGHCRILGLPESGNISLS